LLWRHATFTKTSAGYTFAALDDIAAVKTSAVASLSAMGNYPAVGGNEEKFFSSLHGYHWVMTVSLGKHSRLKLNSYQRRTETAHLFTSVSARSYDAVRLEVIVSLTTFIYDRLENNDLTALVPVLFSPKSWLGVVRDKNFVQNFSIREMTEFHNKFVPDLQLSNDVTSIWWKQR
jgi:hypothetical protein